MLKYPFEQGGYFFCFYINKLLNLINDELI